jgi:hypothetical protein
MCIQHAEVLAPFISLLELIKIYIEQPYAHLKKKNSNEFGAKANNLKVQ